MVNENILKILGQTGGGQSQPLQSPVGVVQQQGDMSGKPESKNDKLKLFLYALGGALKGDKEFVQNTLALQNMQEGKKKQEEQKKIYQDFIKNMEGKYDQRMIDLAKILPPEQGSELLMKTFTKTDDVPADIKKLEQYGLLKSRLDEGSEYYDPSYSLEDLNRDASILGVNARLLDKTEKQYIDDYMKEGRKEKTFSGQRIYTDEQLLEQAKKSYNLVYGGSPAPSPSPKIDEEEIIDLGRL